MTPSCECPGPDPPAAPTIVFRSPRRSDGRAPARSAAPTSASRGRGRYSQLLADGLPLYGTQGDSFSLLQVPPLDLGRVEVIKGVASALYGASALGGVINLLSRLPSDTEHQFLVNTTANRSRHRRLVRACTGRCVGVVVARQLQRTDPARPGQQRLAAGTGAFAPSPFTEETEETGLSRVLPLRDIRAEHARGTSIDLTRVLGPWEVTATVFGSVVDDPLQRRIVDAAHVALVNVDGQTRTAGTELLVRYRAGEFSALFTHGWTRSTEIDPDVDPNDGDRRDRSDMSLTGISRDGTLSVWAGRQGIDRASRPVRGIADARSSRV